jgi:hypothetical protein
VNDSVPFRNAFAVRSFSCTGCAQDNDFHA